jgi:mannosyl-oligosaccharide glucosidase
MVSTDMGSNTCAFSALSNLISGIGFYYGAVKIKERRDPQPKMGLLTACPSKTTFPRGFLWDEGFHGLIYCKWNYFLCLNVLDSWLNTQLDTGWIPRE